MNKLQKEKIKNLRESGCGYKKIANELGISVNTIKSYCRTNGLNGDVKIIDTCLTCQADLPPSKTKKRKFCSNVCREKWWSKNRVKLNKRNSRVVNCQNCGNEMKLYSHENRKFCRHECYVEHRFGGGAHHG